MLDTSAKPLEVQAPSRSRSTGVPRPVCAICFLLPWTLFVMREFHLRALLNDKQLAQEDPAFWMFALPQSKLASLLEGATSSPETGAGEGSPVAVAQDQGNPLLPSSQRPSAVGATPRDCSPGIWNVTLESAAKLKCTLRDKVGRNLCSTGFLSVIVPGTSCESFELVKVESCTEKDLKCKRFNCKTFGVLRLERGAGVLVDVGSDDQMLTCGNSGFKISSSNFCPESGQCSDKIFTTTSTTSPLPVPKIPDVLEVVSSAKPTATFGSCALVGASTNLLKANLGAEIDGHDTVIRVNRMPTEKYFADFGRRTDVYFCHDKNVGKGGFSVQYMDGEWKQCGTVPNRTVCSSTSHFVWLNIWNDEWIDKYRKLLKRSNETFFVGATKLKVGCLANLLLNNRQRAPPMWESTSWRWQSSGFGAFLTFGYLCKSLRLYGFGGLSNADSQHGAENAALEIHNYTREHEMMNRIISGSLDATALVAGDSRCAREGLAWLRRSLVWYSLPGRITSAAHVGKGSASVVS